MGQVMFVHNEADLIQAARAGDGSAFADLVRPHYQAAFRVAYGMLHDADEAEDVVQEAALQGMETAWQPSRGLQHEALASSHRGQSMLQRQHK